ncbi:MAG: bifunctional folylpolyglutamate synthase/dihydrofolate synthase [Dehalococcoidia bacterium]|nr:bifunctional folylpolyglutamate synthase/dihydrofolate synthase [Dehalococcoidia bacterium]
MNQTRYDAARRFVDSFIHEGKGPPAPSERPAFWRLRLETMRALMDQLGEPHRGFASVHVGGTSGKGSVSAFIASVLQAAGYRVGLHTTPFLQSPREKCAVNGELIGQDEFVETVHRLTPALSEVVRRFPGYHPSYVQVSTALAFQHFATQQVDVAVVEVSVGGRFDFTNVLAPEVAVVTNVGMDHAIAIGPAIEDIAWHKAGIIKAGVPAISGVADPRAAAVVAAQADGVGAPLLRLGIDFSCSPPTAGPKAGRFDWECLGGPAYRDLSISLHGDHQVENAGLAVAAVDALGDRGFPVDHESLRIGLKRAFVPGRLEIVQQRPTVVLDGAHNKEKVRTLAGALRGLFGIRPLTVVLGVGAAKDVAGIVEMLAKQAVHVVCTQAGVRGKPAVNATELAAFVSVLGVTAEAVADPDMAVERAIRLAGSNGVVCITGSFYLVGRVRDRWSANPDPVEQVVAGHRPVVSF